MIQIKRTYLRLMGDDYQLFERWVKSCIGMGVEFRGGEA